MKKTHLSKISRKELKEVFGGTLVHALECYSDRECSGRGEGMIRCPDGTTSMTGHICMGGTCVMATGFCGPLVLDPGPHPGPMLP
ncbi:hypothetical protein ACM46_01135 [Chryseobacterium angstadtii]|uniref:Bacteriocin n=1 Tax=Chryseobacterium angstadtii TaxID=558151 RepID=A0A0J7IJN2_9FLAO|nr:hypothetical protein [Chryseobacterium angstadtii]KMQ66196.1 hypothetical protein ACM46_01135 [Chryseobacterium angstadtii]